MYKQSSSIYQVRSALFLDFDNIYIHLSELDKDVADHFATNPERWLTWLESQMPGPPIAPDSFVRRILIRKCYLNPQSFATCRPYFIRSAFEVVDCPPLTSMGKTSTDIHMVMDILDALGHETVFNEFIILSGDADFTPVLLRLRKHDRRSAVLAVGYASPAYKSASDFLIDAEVFIRNAMGVDMPEEDNHVQIRTDEINGATADLLERMAVRLYDVAHVPDGIEASDLPAVYMEFSEFRRSDHWLGFYSLRRLTEALLDLRDDLLIVEEDPWRVATRDMKTGMALSLASASQPACTLPVDRAGSRGLEAEIADCIRTAVTESPAPVSMAALAQAVQRSFPERIAGTRWLGCGSFGSLLGALDLEGLEISSVTPGYVFDPQCHEAPVAGQKMDRFEQYYPELAQLASKVHRLTETPYLMPEHYATLLRELAREINESGYQMSRTSKTVRDRCVERGAPIARSHVNFVLIGISHTGYRFGEGNSEKAEELGAAFADNIINMCRAAQLELDDADTDRIRRWILGELDESPAPSQPEVERVPELAVSY